MNLHPRIAFAEREGFDDLGASFRSLYKSIFGHSIQGSGEYFNDIPTSQGVVPDISNSAAGDLSLSSGSSLPLGASTTGLFSSLRNPQFTSLMDSFRDIADSNSWDKLDPAQIQGLMDSFKIGEHDKFGLDPDVYAELHASFNQFLSQLNNRFLTGSSDSTPQLSEYDRYSHPPSVMSHAASRVNGHGMVVPKYHTHHQLDMVSPLVSVHQASPPSAFCPNRTPSPHTHHTSPTQGQIAGGPHIINQQFGGFVNSSHAPSLTAPNGTQGGMPIRSVATELFDDDDDFDWSRLM